MLQQLPLQRALIIYGLLVVFREQVCSAADNAKDPGALLINPQIISLLPNRPMRLQTVANGAFIASPTGKESKIAGTFDHAANVENLKPDVLSGDLANFRGKSGFAKSERLQSMPLFQTSPLKCKSAITGLIYNASEIWVEGAAVFQCKGKGLSMSIFCLDSDNQTRLPGQEWSKGSGLHQCVSTEHGLRILDIDNNRNLADKVQAALTEDIQRQQGIRPTKQATTDNQNIQSGNRSATGHKGGRSKADRRQFMPQNMGPMPGQVPNPFMGGGGMPMNPMGFQDPMMMGGQGPPPGMGPMGLGMGGPGMGMMGQQGPMDPGMAMMPPNPMGGPAMGMGNLMGGPGMGMGNPMGNPAMGMGNPMAGPGMGMGPGGPMGPMGMQPQMGMQMGFPPIQQQNQFAGMPACRSSLGRLLAPGEVIVEAEVVLQCFITGNTYSLKPAGCLTGEGNQKMLGQQWVERFFANTHYYGWARECRGSIVGAIIASIGCYFSYSQMSATIAPGCYKIFPGGVYVSCMRAADGGPGTINWGYNMPMTEMAC